MAPPSRRRTTLLLILGVVLIACGFAHPRAVTQRAIHALVSHNYPEVPWIDGTTLARALNGAVRSAPLLLDARSEAEFSIGHIRGAVRVDASQTPPLLNGVERARPIVVYCSVGYRSASIARGLIRRGHRDVRNLAGGVFAWANAGRPVYRGDRVVREVHPYALPWGLLLRRELRAELAR